jgi:hypothetical protein
MEKFERVLDLMKRKGGTIELSDPELQSLLGRLIYRVSVYISFIRRFSMLEVKSIREGRKVVAYSLVEVNPNATDDSRWQSSKYLTRKGTPASSAASVDSDSTHS